MGIFLTQVWLDSLVLKLNSDERYAKIAKNWEGDMLFVIDPDGQLSELKRIYLDLWHGKCRKAFFLSDYEVMTAAFTLKAPYENFKQVLSGELEPMRAMLTRKLGVQGNMAVMMRNIPTVLDFVRCCQEVTLDEL